VPPQFAGRRAVLRARREQLRDALLGGGIGADDPVQLPQERQPRRRLAVAQDEDQRKRRLFHAAIVSFVILDRLPRTEAAFPDEQDEARCRGDLGGEGRNSIGAGAQAHRGKADRGLRVPMPQPCRQRVGQHEILRVVAEKPALGMNRRHSSMVCSIGRKVNNRKDAE
jgi:hypothetical protein